MIRENNRIFTLNTETTSYILRITEAGHAEHIYYGARLPDEAPLDLAQKHEIALGTQVAYSEETGHYCLDDLLLEYSGIGKGDYRHTPMELIMPDGSFVTDFVFERFEITDTPVQSQCELPFASGEAQSLILTFHDKKYEGLKLTLSYTVFNKSNVIARSTSLHNTCGESVYIRKLMSFMMDMPTADYDLITLDGGWAKEAHRVRRPLTCGISVNDSTVGASSNRRNPAFLIMEKDANETRGEVYGFNLVYSGNHYSALEVGSFGTLRIMSGINPHCFLWKLQDSESFTAPQAVMTYSANGINEMSQNMHDFINDHIVREKFRYSERPVVINNWEATFFHFNSRKLLALARRAKMLGVEMFVLDDGWFGSRSSDTAGLGDWTPNTKKLRGGVAGFGKRIRKMGMRFGLWFEPECVNQDSDLYRAHPDYAIAVPGRTPSLGRNQMTLDLTRKEVRDYIVNAVSKVLTQAPIDYVKWDYNRHLSDMFSQTLQNQGEFFHRYILGLYEVLRRIFVEKHPDVLLESCSSGGNRFDLGMLCFSPQIWTSDNTDARERMEIQRGISTFYPLSAISAHVSMTPNQQTLRTTPLSTRFNTAAFGVLGYELDFSELTHEERRQIKEQIAFYKAHRKTFQYGKFTRMFPKEGKRESWQAEGEDEIMAGIFNLQYDSCPARDVLKVPGAKQGLFYRMRSVKQAMKLLDLGSLIKHVSPVALRGNGLLLKLIDSRFSLKNDCEEYILSGDALRAGVPLAMQYSGTGYSKKLRLTADYGSTLYHIEKIPSPKETGKEHDHE